MANKPDAVITINRPNIQMIKVKIRGTAPLIFHKWSEKAIRMMEDKQAKKAQKGRDVRDPEAEYQESFYKDRNGHIAFPASNIKQAMVGATRNVEGVHMTLMRGAVFTMGDEDGLIPVEYETVEMRKDMVRVGNGAADIRYRGQVKNWTMEFLIKYNADVLSAEQVINLLQIAGFSQGLGEWRPEKNGDFGTFSLDYSDNEGQDEAYTEPKSSTEKVTKGRPARVA